MNSDSEKNVSVGDRVRLRKPHPCGGDEWQVVRMGADVRLRCLSCGRQITLPRSRFERRLKEVLPPTDANATAPDEGTAET